MTTLNYNEQFISRNKLSLNKPKEFNQVNAIHEFSYSIDDEIKSKKEFIHAVFNKINKTKYFLLKNELTADEEVKVSARENIKKQRLLLEQLEKELQVLTSLKSEELKVKAIELSLEKERVKTERHLNAQTIESTANVKFSKQIIKEFVKIRDGINEGFLTTDSILKIINNAFEKFDLERSEQRIGI